MRAKHTSRRLLVLGLFAGGVLATILLGHPFGGRAAPNIPSTSPAAKAAVRPASPGLPVRLTAPEINLSATVRYVGRAANGDMDMVKSQSDVAWYKLGQRPGNIGTAVIAGHYGWDNGTAAVFNDISKLRKGDKLNIIDAAGTITTFMVRRSQTYAASADTTAVFNSHDGKAHLNLITCEGIWNEATQSYPERLVVFADKP